MKSILVIGMGRFGRHLASKMTELGNDVMIVDNNHELIDELSPNFTDAYIGDCNNEGVLRSLGVSNFDICFVTIGEDFQSSVIITSHLKKLGAKYIVTKTSRDIQADILKTIGANEVVYPEREIAEKLAVRYNSNNIFDYIELTNEYAIYEVPIIPSWAGKSVLEVNVRRRYNINIIAIKQENKLDPSPGPDYVFNANDHIVIIGKSTDVFKLSAKT